MAVPWWRRSPGRLRAELKALRRAGLPYVIDRESFGNGELKLDVTIAHEGTPYLLKAVYPGNYPYFEPTVYALDSGFRYHQNPFGKNLCLIGRGTERWWSNWTLAYALLDRFPKLIAANTFDRDQTAELEVDQGEPLAVFYSVKPGAAFLVDGSWSIPENLAGGWLRIGFRHRKKPKIGAIVRVEDFDHNPVCSLPTSLAKQFSEEIWGRWTRVPEFVREDDPEKFRRCLEAVNSRIRKPYWVPLDDEVVDIIGVIYPEEVQRRGTTDGWVFWRRTGKRKKGGNGLLKIEPTATTLIKAQRSGKADYHARNPHATMAATKRVAVIGLGCIGGPLALELAKIGCSLSLIDADEVEVGPTVRWPVGLEYTGWNKAKALQHFIGRHWPYTDVEAQAIKIGADHDADDAIIRESDLIIDATAEIGVQRYLSDSCSALCKPLIIVATTPGGWGGRIARLGPCREKHPCRVCLWHYEYDGTVSEPPSDPNGTFQPKGCGDISFHACAVDTCEVSLAGARLALSTLLEGSDGAYPVTSWNIGTILLRSSNGELIGPKLETWQLPPHPACRNHQM